MVKIILFSAIWIILVLLFVVYRNRQKLRIEIENQQAEQTTEIEDSYPVFDINEIIEKEENKEQLTELIADVILDIDKYKNGKIYVKHEKVKEFLNRNNIPFVEDVDIPNDVLAMMEMDY